MIQLQEVLHVPGAGLVGLLLQRLIFRHRLQSLLLLAQTPVNVRQLIPGAQPYLAVQTGRPRELVRRLAVFALRRQHPAQIVVGLRGCVVKFDDLFQKRKRLLRLSVFHLRTREVVHRNGASRRELQLLGECLGRQIVLIERAVFPSQRFIERGLARRQLDGGLVFVNGMLMIARLGIGSLNWNAGRA